MRECSQMSKLVALIMWLSCVVVLHGQQDSKVAVKWGVADSTATVGRLFRMHIPGDAFSGDITSYTVQCSDGSPLPSWLEFDSHNNVLQGIPTSKGNEQVFLTITAHGVKGQASVACTIFIRDVPSHTMGMPLRFRPSGPDFVHCQEKEPETVTTIILDVDIETLAVPERLKLLSKFISHMQLHEDMIKMIPVGNTPMNDASALVSGTGDCQTPKTSGLFISWPVGCGQVKEGHFPVLQKLDDDSGTGRMAKVLGFPVIGWKVTNSHLQAPTRKRRQVHSTPTPVVTPIMPTKTETKQDKTDDTNGKMTHQVVVTQSPTFIHPTATQPTMHKTDEPFVTPPLDGGAKAPTDKIQPTETTMTKTQKPSKTKELPAIKPTTTDESSKPTDIPVVDGCMPGQKPVLQHPIQRQVYHVGEIIDYHIPEDTFSDCEVGGTPKLDLLLFRETSEKIEPDFFLQFDSARQRIFGLPMEGDIGKFNFSLIARKKSNLMMANTPINVQVKGSKNKKKTHELSLTFDLDYDNFMKNATERIQIGNKIASVYGDPDGRKMIITKIASGSVIYAWTNSSLSSSKLCPSEEITGLVRKLVNEDGTFTDNAVRNLKPYVLLGANAAPAGNCVGEPSFPVVKTKIPPPIPPHVDGTDKDDDDDEDKEGVQPVDVDKDDKFVDGTITKKPDITTFESVAKSGKDTDDEDDIWITTVIPAVVIVVILLIALLIACILYRTKRKGKMNVEEQNTFINKGAPVIFPDELEDKPSDVNKPLLLEGSLAPPPEYHRGTSESPERHIGIRIRNTFTSHGPDDGIIEMPEKPYEPPPPLTASSNNKQPRTTHSQQPYSQPPQILP